MTPRVQQANEATRRTVKNVCWRVRISNLQWAQTFGFLQHLHEAGLKDTLTKNTSSMSAPCASAAAMARSLGDAGTTARGALVAAASDP
jgi:hypothetical protein